MKRFRKVVQRKEIEGACFPLGMFSITIIIFHGFGLLLQEKFSQYFIDSFGILLLMASYMYFFCYKRKVYYEEIK